jgi:hypothetical protein
VEKRTKVACRNKGCNFFGFAAFDGRCPDCAQTLDAGSDDGGAGGIMDAVTGTEPGQVEATTAHCSECEALVEEGNSFCTNCGAQFAESGDSTVAESVHCYGCGIDVEISEDESSCPRCSAPIVEAKADDDDDEDEDDEDDEDGEEDGEEDDEEEDGKKVLLDKGRKGKKCEDVVPLSPREEAKFLIDLAVGLDENGRQDLAAHIVWGEVNNREIADDEIVDRPRWVPEEHDEDWKKAQGAGRSKTFMGQVHVFQGLVARR